MATEVYAAYLTLAELISRLPPEWGPDVWPEIERRFAQADKTVVVFDDDPTGCQTVHGVTLITEWSVEAIAEQLRRKPAAFYLLTNSRSMPRAEAEAVNRAAARNLAVAAQQTGRDFVVISRGDSTLRGHFPHETEALCQGLQSGGITPPDATLFIPFFGDGGRITWNDTHFLATGDGLFPVGETEFARDHTFGYRTSHLPEWIREKCPLPVQVDSIAIEDIRTGGPTQVASRLARLPQGCICVVNAVTQRDLEAFTLGLLDAEERGCRFLYRTAATFVQTRATICPRPLLTKGDFELAGAAGLIVVGSHTANTTEQLQALIGAGNIVALEVNVSALLDTTERSGMLEDMAARMNGHLARGKDVVLFTSRHVTTGLTPLESLAISKCVSESLIGVVSRIATRPRYVITKGGITSHDIATEALGVKRALVLGQIEPGIPVWRLHEEARFPGMPYVVFPGNVGKPNSLANIAATLGCGDY